GGGQDIRAYVVAATCVALMRRVAPPGEIRANLAQGATGSPLSLDHPAGQIAAAALRACGLDFGGVDMVEDSGGAVRVLEVDAWAGFAGITAVTRADVAGAILRPATAPPPRGGGRRPARGGRARRGGGRRAGGAGQGGRQRRGRRGGRRGMTVAVARNPYATNVSTSLIAAAGRLGIPARPVDLPSLRLGIGPLGDLAVTDSDGPIAPASPAPYLLFGFPAAAHALRAPARTGHSQNPVHAVVRADDKAAAAYRLARAGVPQVRTEVCPFDAGQVSAVAAEIGYPVVVKRAHGAQGRWVRRAAGPEALAAALAELAQEGPGALIV